MSAIKHYRIFLFSRLCGILYLPIKGLRSVYFRFSILALIFLLIALVGFTLNGHFGKVGNAWMTKMGGALSKIGLGIDITVSGRKNTDLDVLLDVVNVEEGHFILNIDLPSMHQRIEKMPWVKEASVIRILPNMLHIKIVEHKAFVRWKKDNNIVLIGRRGHLITHQDICQYNDLPLVMGHKSNIHIAVLMDILKNYPSIYSHVVGAERISDRRWNLYLKHHNVVYLPAQDISVALQVLTHIEKSKHILDIHNQVIDLRLSDRVILRKNTLPMDHMTGSTGEIT